MGVETMNSFQRFGIDHLSPSSLNLWRSGPGIWVLRYIGKLKDGGNAAMWRGTAVEQGFAALLRSKDLGMAKTVAENSFHLNSRGEISDEIDAERDLIDPMLEQCLRWKQPSDLNATQIKVEHWFDPLPIPVVGYLDFAFEETDVDLKTTKTCPSKPRADHVRQVSLYRAARSRQGGLLYVTDKRHAYFPVDDDMMERALGDMHSDALSLNNFLARCETREDALRSLPVDWDHYQAPKVKVPLEQILLAG
jgi:hypothetical protein